MSDLILIGEYHIDVGLLLDRLKEVEAEAETWKETLKFNEGCWREERGTMIRKIYSEREENESLRDVLGIDPRHHVGKATIDGLKDYRDQLHAENAGLRTGYQAYERVNAELKAEAEGLRKDADKWQIVERAMTQLQSDEHGAAIWSACSRILISVASELNSVRSVVTEEGVTNGGVEIGDWRVTVERITSAMGKGEQS